MVMFLSVGNVWAVDTYVKVTSAPSDWSGEYLLVYESSATEGVAWTGVDAASCRVDVSISNGEIATVPSTAVTLTIASMQGGYSIKVNGGTNNGKYISGTSGSNKTNFVASAVAATLDYDGTGKSVSITSNTSVMRYNSGNTGQCFRFYKSSTYTNQKAVQLYKKTSSITPADACAAPTFSPAAGAVASGTQVSISCSTEGAAIHYTTDGSTPTASSATYSSAITVSSAMTIKAIAVKDGLSDSEPATAAYTILEPKTIAQIMPTSSDEGDEFLLNDVTVTYAYGSNVYVKDATGYMLIFKNIAGAANGKVLHGLQGKAKLYSNLPEISTITKDPNVVNGNEVDPVPLTAYPVAADLNKYVTMEDVSFTSNVSFTSGSVTNVTGSFDGKNLVFRNTFKINASLTGGTSYRVVGIVQKYNTNFQVYPISFEEIVGETQVATPTFSPAAGTYTSVQNVTISCETTGATIHYTTNGDEPTASSPAYSSAIEVGESMTIKAIAVKEGLDDSNVASAAYTINLPLPEHTFQVTHHFSTGEGFEFPTGWGGSYAEHEIAYTDDKVHFASASHQSGTITDRPVVKEGAVSLILTNSHKLISAVRFDYSQWTTKVPTLTMKYSTDGGETYSNFNPVVSTTDFALQVLDMPENVNAIQVVGTTDKQVGLTSIAFDLVDKPIVTKIVTITTPSNGTLTVMNGEDAVSSGDEIEVNSILTITATPSEGYKLIEVTVNGNKYTASTLTLTENVTIAASFEENLAELVNSYVLSEIGTETSRLVEGQRVGDKVNLPPTAATCSKTFVGWDKNPSCEVAPEYAPGAEYTLELDNKLYAVYAATPDDNAPTELFATTSLGSTNTVTDGYAVSAAAGAKEGYYQDGGNTGDKRHVQIMVSNTETQIIPAQPSAITVTATLGGGSTNDALTNPVYAVLLNASGEEIGDAVVMTSAIEVAAGKEYSQNLPVANFADVRGVRIYHVRENKGTQGYNVRYFAISLSYAVNSYSGYSTDCDPIPATLESIAIDGSATHLEYTAGDEFDPAGLSVIGHYSDNSEAEITEGITWAFDPATLSKTDESVSVTATVGEITSAAFVVDGLTVNAAAPTTNNVVIIAEYESKFYAMTNDPNDLNSGALTAIEITKDGDNIVVPSEEAKTAIQWTKKTSDNTTFQDADGKYLAHSGTGTSLTLQDADTEEPELWTLHADGYYYAVEGRTFFYYKDDIFKNYSVSNLPASKTDYSGAPEIRVIAAENIVVVAPTTHTLSYNANGGTLIEGKDAIADAQVAENATVTVAANVYEKEGYVFAGWLYGETVYNVGQTFDMPTEDVELVAQWAAISTDDVVILAKCQGQWYAVQGVAGASNHTVAAVPVVYEDNVIYLVESKRASITWERTAAGTLASFKNGENYLSGRTSDSNDLDLSEDECWWSFNTDLNIYQTNAIHSILYSSQVGLFKNYKTSNKSADGETGNYSALPIVVPAVFGDPSYTTVREELAPNAYYTMCLEKAVDAVQGGSVWKIVSKAQGSLDIILEEVTGTLDAGRPYIFYATSDIFKVVYAGSAVLEPVNDEDNNGLVGSFSQAHIANVNTNYIIYNNELYYVNTDNVYVGAHRAYIDMTAVPDYSEPQQGNAPRRRVTMHTNAPQVATGVDALNASETPVKKIIDGNLYILRGEKMFNANGQLVK